MPDKIIAVNDYCHVVIKKIEYEEEPPDYYYDKYPPSHHLDWPEVDIEVMEGINVVDFLNMGPIRSSLKERPGI